MNIRTVGWVLKWRQDDEYYNDSTEDIDEMWTKTRDIHTTVYKSTEDAKDARIHNGWSKKLTAVVRVTKRKRMQ